MQRKRDPLSSGDVLMFENLMAKQDADPRDRIFAGFVLFCIGARLRVGDAAKIKEEPTLDMQYDVDGSGAFGFV